MISTKFSEIQNFFFLEGGGENEKWRQPTSAPRRQKPVKTSSNITGIFLLRHSFTSTRWKSGSIISIPPAPWITTEKSNWQRIKNTENSESSLVPPTLKTWQTCWGPVADQLVMGSIEKERKNKWNWFVGYDMKINSCACKYNFLGFMCLISNQSNGQKWRA